MQASSEHYDLYSPNLNFWVTRQVTQIMRASLRTLWFVQSQPQFLGHPPGDPNHAGFPRNIMICTVATSIFRSPARWRIFPSEHYELYNVQSQPQFLGHLLGDADSRRKWVEVGESFYWIDGLRSFSCLKVS